ncbi:MAG TPA: hypothetical protein VHT97_01980 [Acidimicrobiales bacterium]|jgi:hypothetical protein|nr:hypothetical protein [Acidimicrobiales bacterium]
MDILSALFVEGINQRQVPGPSTRFDLTGVMFSLPAPGALPVDIAPHLVVFVRCGPDEPGTGTLEVEFIDGDGKEVARNAQPVTVQPGKFGRLLVKGELTYESYGTIEAHVKLTGGAPVVVPLTLLAPA